MAANNNHFSLTLDTLAPTGSITRPAAFMNANANLTIVIGDAVRMKVWRNANATGTKSDTGYSDGAWITAATTHATNFSASVKEYYHLVLMDSVGNESDVYNTEMITFDAVVPTTSDFALYDKSTGASSITNEREVYYGFKFDDDLSGVVSYTITGDCTTVTAADIPASKEITYADKRALTLTAGDGTKQVSLIVTDACGNTSVARTASIELDTSVDKPVLSLFATQAKAEAYESVLPTYINFHPIYATLTTSYEVEGMWWKIWEDGTTEPTEWTQYTAAEIIDVESVHTYYRHIEALTLSSGDGAKIVHAKVRDSVPTEYAADDKTVTIDTVIPVAENTRTGAEWISQVTGHTSSTIHIKASDATAGVHNWVLDCNGTQVEAGDAAVDKDVTITYSTAGMVEGANTFTLTVYDNAQNAAGEYTNVNTAAATVSYDNTAPTASITQLNTWYTAEFPITANTSDTGAGVSTIYAWVSMTSGDEACPSGTTGIARTAAAQVIPAADINWDALQQSANNYMHIKVVDAVGNVSYAHCKFGFDNVAPTVETFAFALDRYTSTTATLNVTYTDATSGVAYMKITGTGISDPDADYVAVAASRSKTLTDSEGYKLAQVQLKDTAGNESTIFVVTNNEGKGTYLDKTAPGANIALKNRGAETAKENPSAVRTFDAWINPTDASTADNWFYHYWGAGIGVGEEPTTWETYTPATGKSYQVIESECTTGDGTKEVYVRFKDAAGNVGESASASFVLDTTAPEPTIENLDVDRISEVHITRPGESSIYADEAKFDIVPGENIQAWKCCAYMTQALAAAGSHTDPAIPSTAGSTNMSGSGISSSATISCVMKGTDYKTALGVTEAHEGLHFVTVYVQDMAGTWSGAAVFAV